MASDPSARCVNCREEVRVSDRYAHGDHIKCGACGTDHKLARGGEKLRLVIGDVSPLRDALAQNGQLVSRLEGDLARARASFGIGANGLGIAVVFVVYRLAVSGAALDSALILSAIAIAVVSGAALEAANWSFLAKRSQIERLSRELADAKQDGSRLRALIREASRV